MHVQTVPQLGVNDLTAKVAGWLVPEGAKVAAGTAVAELETTKAVVEVTADGGGFIVFLAAKGDELEVSAPLALIGDDLGALKAEQATRAAAAAARPETQGASHVTRKAAALAAQLGLDLAEVMAATPGLVREAEVLRLHNAKALGDIRLPDAFATEADRLPVAIWGAGNGAVTMREAIDLAGTHQVVCFVADRPVSAATKDGLPLLPDTLLAELAAMGLAGIGLAITSSVQRLASCRRLQELGVAPLTVVHPRAWVAPSATLGKGSHIKAGALVETAVAIGDACQIDNGVVVAHHTAIGDGCHLAPGAALGSGITVGAGTIIGIGASVSTSVSIGTNCIVSVGSSVSRDVPDNSVVEGVPGRIIGRRK